MNSNIAHQLELPVEYLLRRGVIHLTHTAVERETTSSLEAFNEPLSKEREVATLTKDERKIAWLIGQFALLKRALELGADTASDNEKERFIQNIKLVDDKVDSLMNFLESSIATHVEIPEGIKMNHWIICKDGKAYGCYDCQWCREQRKKRLLAIINS